MEVESSEKNKPCLTKMTTSPPLTCVASGERMPDQEWVRSERRHYVEAAVDWCRLVLPRHACCILSRLHCNEHSLLLSSYLSRNGRIENHAAPADIRAKTLSPYSALFAPLAFWRISVSLRPLVQVLGSCPVSGSSWSSPCSLPSNGVC